MYSAYNGGPHYTTTNDFTWVWSVTGIQFPAGARGFPLLQSIQASRLGLKPKHHPFHWVLQGYFSEAKVSRSSSWPLFHVNWCAPSNQHKSHISRHLMTWQMKFTSTIRHDTITTEAVKQRFGLSANRSNQTCGTMTCQLWFSKKAKTNKLRVIALETLGTVTKFLSLRQPATWDLSSPTLISRIWATL
jgi:hypothetical protein